MTLLSRILWRIRRPRQSDKAREIAKQINAAMKAHRPTRELRRKMALVLAGKDIQ